MSFWVPWASKMGTGRPFRQNYREQLFVYDFNAPLQPFAWFGGLGVSGWSKLTLFWEVWGLAGALDSAAGWLDGIWVADW